MNIAVKINPDDAYSKAPDLPPVFRDTPVT